jgi:transcriptional regulator with XRE-family HTH domain
MDSTALGKKIKEARLAKKMTQSEVVGDFITRNMLSQIESGTAYPSVKTLEYLANVLEIPLQSLISSPKPQEENTEQFDHLITVLENAKASYLNQNYDEVLTMLKPFSMDDTHPIYDESCALMARAHLKLAEKKRLEGMISSATDHANHAQEYSKKGIYAGREIRTAALLLLDRLADDLDPTAE